MLLAVVFEAVHIVELHYINGHSIRMTIKLHDALLNDLGH